MALLDRLSEEIKKKRLHMQKNKVLFHQDAPCHKPMKAMVKLNELSFEMLLHTPYSPDLASTTTGSLLT